ncbi:MAG: patatin-like phospholipase family protein [Gammaproteobacteria bacterium]|nr:patatin-like phospholipase family protein [Gammaproteobacteria bacterium]
MALKSQPLLLPVLLLSALLLSACGALERKAAVPAELQSKAVIADMKEVRYRIGVDNATLEREAIASFERERNYLRSKGVHSLPPANFLAVSGGGDNGAFGAGLLNGWSAAGSRPEFKLVTGVSTGALIAPYAFLGKDYDEQLKRFYTTLKPADLIKRRSILAAITSDALSDNLPLAKLVEKEITQEMLEAIAREYKKGRLLLIGTTDLDARSGVIWNMTRIAASGSPDALKLFHKILVASSAIPGAFPPVMIDVEALDKKYHEMHVDGGAVAQVFVYPPSFHLKDLSGAKNAKRERRAFIIRNARLDPDWHEVQRSTMSIAGRAISSLINSQGIGDLYRIFMTTQRDGVDFNLAFIPPTFKAEHKEEFDTEYMRQLYQTGFEMAVKGYPWQKRPPG